MIELLIGLSGGFEKTFSRKKKSDKEQGGW